MKIRTKFYFSTSFLLIMIVLIGSVQLLVVQRRNTVFAKQHMADKIVDHITGLNRLTFDFIMDPSERAHTQWTSTHRQLAQIIAATSFDTPSEQQMLRKIQRNHANLQVIFSIFVEKLGESASDDETPARELLDRLTKQLLIKSEDIVSGAHQLSNLIRNDLKKIHQQNSIFIFSTVIVISILIILNSILIAKSITRPIDTLTAGARHFGKGDLEYRIANITGDEIGDLSQAFNQMARNLNRITVS
ncbi:MAG: HAMP domain-containing protein, partial [Desulfobacteraceae bacterium]